MRIFDLKTGEVERNIADGTAGAHSEAVASLAARGDNVLLASGGVDGIAKIYNVFSGKNIGAFDCRKSKKSDDDLEAGDDGVGLSASSTVESVLFTRAEQNILVTGSLEGVVAVWDLSTQVRPQKHLKPHPNLCPS
jgi:WD40 repeat protein